VDTSWYNALGNSFTISDEADFAGLAQIVNGTAEGITKDSFAIKKLRCPPT
jgi:predicted chitinase